MRRTTVVALVAAGVIGITAGTVTAVVRGPADLTGDPAPSAPPSSSSSRPASTTSAAPSPKTTTTPDPSAGPTTNRDPRDVLLYAGAKKTIHDGSRTITYEAPFALPDQLFRTADGYLITHPVNLEDMSPVRLYAVEPAGSTRMIAEIVGAWDLNGQRNRVAGTDRKTGKLVVWDLTGKKQAAIKPPVKGDISPVWYNGAVLLNGRRDDQGTPLWRYWRWEPDANTIKLLDHLGPAGPYGSADGKLIVGSVGVEGDPTGRDDTCERVESAPGAGKVSWKTCDWQRNWPEGAFSPDGTRMLMVPYGGDGFGPQGFVVFSATVGPSRGLTKITSPDFTLDGHWLDDTHLIFHSRTDGELDDNTGTVLTSCDLTSACTVLARRVKGDLTLGEQY